MKKIKINIVLSTADDFQYMYIVMETIIDNIPPNTICNFIILATNSFTEKKEDIVRILERKNTNIRIKVFRIENRFKDVKLNHEWIGVATFFRLLIPEILNDEDKCLYLDTDIIVCDNICELYMIDISEYMLAGVKAIAYHIAPEHIKQENTEILKIDSMNQYINAGVILMNLKKMRQNHFSEIAMSLINNNYASQDQDIINKICYGNILTIPLKFNVMTKYFDFSFSQYQNVMTDKEIMEGWSKPIIIHYADRIKPWNDFSCPMSEYWWMACKKSDMWNYFYYKKQNEIFSSCFLKKQEKLGIETWKYVKLKKILWAENILLYGAGHICEKIIDELKSLNCHIDGILVTSKINNKDSVCGIPVIEVDKIKNFVRSTLIIVAVSDKFCAEIINIIAQYGYKNVLLLTDGSL